MEKKENKNVLLKMEKYIGLEIKLRYAKVLLRHNELWGINFGSPQAYVFSIVTHRWLKYNPFELYIWKKAEEFFNYIIDTKETFEKFCNSTQHRLLSHLIQTKLCTNQDFKLGWNVSKCANHNFLRFSVDCFLLRTNLLLPLNKAWVFLASCTALFPN